MYFALKNYKFSISLYLYKIYYKNVEIKLCGRKNVLIIITLNASGYVSILTMFYNDDQLFLHTFVCQYNCFWFQNVKPQIVLNRNVS